MANVIKRNLSYPLSKLLATTSINPESLIEISIKDGTTSQYLSRKTTVNDFGYFIITAQPIFNNLQDLFNTVPDTVTFLKPTYFANRPYVEHIVSGKTEDDIILHLANEQPKNNNLVTLYDVKERIRNTGIAVQAAGPSSVVRKYNATNQKWVTTEKPTIISETGYMQSIYKKTDCVEFSYNSVGVDNNAVVGHLTAEIMTEKDMMVHIIANLVLRDTYDMLIEKAPRPYFNNRLNNWLALIFAHNNSNIVGSITTFSEIFKVPVDGLNYAVAQVQLSLPVGQGVAFRLFTPAALNMNPLGLENDERLNRSLFNGINQAHIHYFDENTN